MRLPCVPVRRLAPALLIAFTALASPGEAPAIEFEAIVEVTAIMDPGNLLAGTGLSIGSVVSARYEFSIVPDIDPAPESGQYEGALIFGDLVLGLQNLFVDGTSSDPNRLWVVDDLPLGGGIPGDGFGPQLTSPNSTLGLAPLDGAGFGIYVATTDTTLFASDAQIGAVPPTPGVGWDALNAAQIFGWVGPDIFQIDGVVLSVATAPEPGAGALLLFGLTLLGGLRRQRH